MAKARSRHRMTPAESRLFHLLRHHDRMSKPRSLIRTQFEFVLDFGWWYVPHGEHSLPMGPLQQCVGNAARASATDDGLIYCEGFALFKESSNPVRHAWVTDGSGRAFDVTWSPPGVAYAGIPFKSLFVTMNAVKRRAFVTLLDDWEAGWPLLGKLGNEPDEWLESTSGNGTAKIIRTRRSTLARPSGPRSS